MKLLEAVMAIAFEVTVNNETKIVAGNKDISVLTFILSFRKASKSNEDMTDEIYLQVIGLLHHSEYNNEHLDWMKRHIKLGDEINIRVVETSQITKPITRRSEDPNLVQKAERKYYESLKKKYED